MPLLRSPAQELLPSWVFVGHSMSRAPFGHTHHTYYNIACIHAVLGEPATAMAWLERTVNTGFACYPFFRVDPYLESLREEPTFKRLVAELEETYSALPIHRL